MSQKQACAKNTYQVTTANLPLSCPMPEQDLWDAHPKVFLPIEKTGQAKCEYCGANYVLTDFSGASMAEAKTDVEYADGTADTPR